MRPALAFTLSIFDIPSFFYIVTHGGQKSKKNKQNINKPAEINLMAQHDELLITQILNPESPTAVSILPTPASAANNAPKHNHPRFGAKQPKQHKAPTCINVECKRRKKELEEELKSTKEQLKSALDKLGKCKQCIFFYVSSAGTEFKYHSY